MVQAERLVARPIAYIVVEVSRSLLYYPFDTQYLQVSQGHPKANTGLVGIARLFVICDKLPRVLHSSGSNRTRYTYVRSNFASALRGFPCKFGALNLIGILHLPYVQHCLVRKK